MKHPARQNFTLIELLVVIAIIAILAAMLMPALKKAKSMTKRVSCANNQHQMNLVYQNYQLDFNGWFPRRENNGSANNSGGTYAYNIGSYLPKAKAKDGRMMTQFFKDPGGITYNRELTNAEWQVDRYKVDLFPAGNPKNWSWVGQHFWNGGKKAYDPNVLSGYTINVGWLPRSARGDTYYYWHNDDGQLGSGNVYGKITKSKPGQAIANSSLEMPKIDMLGKAIPVSVGAKGVKWATFQDEYLNNNTYGSGAQQPMLGCFSRMNAHELTGLNVSYCDGHVKWWSISSARTSHSLCAAPNYIISTGRINVGNPFDL